MTTDHVHVTPEVVGCAAKLKATLQARLALAGGYVLLELADGSYMVSQRGALSQPLPDLYAVRRFAEQVGAT